MADHHRADDAAELAEGVDEGDAACGACASAGEEFGWQGPERRDRGDDAAAEHGQGEDEHAGVLGEDAGAEEADGAEDDEATDEFATFTAGVGEAADDDHADGAADIRDGGEQADDDRAFDARAANQLWCPEVEAVGRDLNQEVDQAEHQEAWHFQGGEQRAAMFVGLVLGDAAGEVGLLVIGQPVGIGDAIFEQFQDGETQGDARQAAEQEQPVPAAHLHHAIHAAEYEAGDGRAQQAGKCRGQEQGGSDAAAVGLREPQRQIEQHTRCEAGFHGADDEAQHVELPFGVDENHQSGGDAPGNHDAGDPATCADLVQHDVARHFEQYVTDDEQARAEAVRGVAQAQVGLQLELGEADVDTVEEGEQVADHDQRHQAPGDFADQRFFGAYNLGEAAVRVQNRDCHCGHSSGTSQREPYCFCCLDECPKWSVRTGSKGLAM